MEHPVVAKALYFLWMSSLAYLNLCKLNIGFHRSFFPFLRIWSSLYWTTAIRWHHCNWSLTSVHWLQSSIANNRPKLWCTEEQKEFFAWLAILHDILFYEWKAWATSMFLHLCFTQSKKATAVRMIAESFLLTQLLLNLRATLLSAIADIFSP